MSSLTDREVVDQENYIEKYKLNSEEISKNHGFLLLGRNNGYLC